MESTASLTLCSWMTGGSHWQQQWGACHARCCKVGVACVMCVLVAVLSKVCVVLLEWHWLKCAKSCVFQAIVELAVCLRHLQAGCCIHSFDIYLLL